VLYATGPGGVTWIGKAVTARELSDAGIAEWLTEMATRRMPEGGELCPLDLLPAPNCEVRLRELLTRIRLADRPHVTVYTRAA